MNKSITFTRKSGNGFYWVWVNYETQEHSFGYLDNADGEARRYPPESHLTLELDTMRQFDKQIYKVRTDESLTYNTKAFRYYTQIEGNE